MINMWLSGACFIGALNDFVNGDIWMGIGGILFSALNLLFGLSESKKGTTS